MAGSVPKTDDQGTIMVETIKLKELFDEFSKLGFIRNWVGAHYNDLADSVSNNDITFFADQSLAFADALTCPSCKSMPEKQNESHFHCRCKKTTMTPLPD
jgi:hypothetical protein